MSNTKQTKHTPGPWRSLGPTIVNGPIGIVKDTYIGTIECTFDVATAHRASKGTAFGGLDESEANARLIAASPSMFDRLDRIIEEFANTGKISRDQIEAAQKIMAAIEPDGKYAR